MRNSALKITFLFLGLPVCLSAVACSCQMQLNHDFIADAVLRQDYTSVYGAVGKRVNLDSVREDEEGRAYATVDGVEYELGMDFLSMAMVYNTAPTQAFPTPTDAYNEWWRLYIQRWNLLVPEVPLYSNQYYDIYNAKIDKLSTSPYWSVANAIVGAKVVSGDNSVILGSATELTGAFRDASFGKSSPASSDLDIQTLTSGYSTIITDKDGNLVPAESDILTSYTQTDNMGGTKTFTMQIADGLAFSDGSPIKAVNYIAPLLVGSGRVMRSAGGSDAVGLTVVGYEDFNAYDGSGEPIPFTGVRLLDERTFAITVKEEYASYYYALRYGAFTPTPTALYLGSYAVKDDGQGAYIEKEFYNKDGEGRYAMSDFIKRNLSQVSASVFPYSGPYFVERYDTASRIAVLRRNPHYKGDHRGKASIERISYVKIVSETQLDQLKKGQVDVLASVTGGEQTKSALAVVDNRRFKETHYDRAGYGKLAFRCDFSPTQFAQVRRAVMHTIDRNEFAQVFTGGYGSVVDAPYYVGSPTYLAVKDRLKLNKYPFSIDEAKRELIKGGWVYNADGSAYDEAKGGVRYKKLNGYEKSYQNLSYASVDNKYKTVKVDGEYYMPLAINWMGTQPNPVTDQLITAWQNAPNAGRNIGAYITYSSGDMISALYGEYYQMPAYGFRKARYGAVNFATGFTSAVYDQAFYWTIDEAMYPNYSSNFLMDEADFLSNYQR